MLAAWDWAWGVAVAAIGQIVAASATVGTLIFFWVQVRLMRDQALAAATRIPEERRAIPNTDLDDRGWRV
jgi:hypothetical protein